MTFTDLRNIERLARIADNFDPDPIIEKAVPARTPAGWWRLGIALLGLLIAIVLLWRVFT